MSKEQDQPLNNPFKNLDKSQYRDARQERRPAPLKIKKSGKIRPVSESSDEDALFAGLMRDSGVAPLEKGKRKAAPAAKTATAAPLPDQALAPEPIQTPDETPSRISFPTPSGQPGGRESSPGAGTIQEAYTQPHSWPPEAKDFTGTPPTLADLSAFATLKTQAKALPKHQEKPAPNPIRVSKGAAPLRGRESRGRAEPSLWPPEASPAPPSAPPPAPAHQAAIPDTWQDEAHALDNDADLFADAVNGVRLLGGGGRAVAVPPPVRVLAGKEPPSDPLRDFMDGKVEFSLEFTDEYLQGHVVGLDAQIINKMKAGEFSNEAHIDLHGLNAMQAWEALVGFFRSAYHKGARCVLVVPGRGLNSPGGAGVLRERLQTWFTQAPFKYVILAFCTALPRHGGAGALYVLLRKQKKTRGKIHWDILPADADLFGEN